MKILFAVLMTLAGVEERPLHRSWMRRAAWISLAILFLLFSHLGWAAPITPGTKANALAPMTGQVVEVEALQAYRSEPTESQTDFLQRVGRDMAAYSREHRVETCASIWTDRVGWALQVWTSHGQTTCVVVTENPADPSFSLSDEFIHSHPYGTRTIQLTTNDERLTGMRARKLVEIYNATFSPTDRAAGPGWLVANGYLQHLDANGTVTRIELGDAIPTNKSLVSAVP